MTQTCPDCCAPFTPDPTDGFSDVRCDACESARIMEEAENFRRPAPPPTPIRARFYICECEHCGWVGSSEQCGTDDGPWGDSDVHCPVCCRAMLADEPSEADIAKHGEAVMQRILAAEADAAALREQLAAEREECARLREALAAAVPLLDHIAGEDMTLIRPDGATTSAIKAAEAAADALGVEIGMSEWVELVLTGKPPARSALSSPQESPDADR